MSMLVATVLVIGRGHTQEVEEKEEEGGKERREEEEEEENEIWSAYFFSCLLRSWCHVLIYSLLHHTSDMCTRSLRLSWSDLLIFHVYWDHDVMFLIHSLLHHTTSVHLGQVTFMPSTIQCRMQMRWNLWMHGRMSSSPPCTYFSIQISHSSPSSSSLTLKNMREILVVDSPFNLLVSWRCRLSCPLGVI